MSEAEQHIADLLSEERVFEPSEAFRAQAVVQDAAIYEQAQADPEAFWSEQAERLAWFRHWDTVMNWTPPFVRWFEGGTLNASYNCLDRHIEAGGGDKVAYHWEGEPGDQRTITYKDLLEEVCRLANALKALGVRRGDRVAIYMGMVPELAIAMLACARIGAPHSVVFGGFSADSLRDRINDAQCKVVVTADGAFRRGTIVELKGAVDQAVAQCPSVTDVVVYRRTGHQVQMRAGRDHWWHEMMEGVASDCPAEPLDSEHLLYILYTSGTTGKPKGIVHTTGGYMVGTYATAKWVFDFKEE